MQQLIRKLIEIQRREGWSDGQMAGQIGISRPSWNLIRRGKRDMWAEARDLAVRRFPELTPELIAAVMSGTEPTTPAAA